MRIALAELMSDSDPGSPLAHNGSFQETEPDFNQNVPAARETTVEADSSVVKKSINLTQLTDSNEEDELDVSTSEVEVLEIIWKSDKIRYVDLADQDPNWKPQADVDQERLFDLVVAKPEPAPEIPDRLESIVPN